MKFGMVNKLTTVNRFKLYTLHRNITHLAIITRKTNIKLGIKSQKFRQKWLFKSLILSNLKNPPRAQIFRYFCDKSRNNENIARWKHER